MFKKIVILFILTFCVVKPIFAETPEELNKQIAEYTQKLIELDKAKDTLANQIKYLENQANLTTLKIRETENTIKTLEGEIQNLAVEINRLDIDLNKLTQAFIEQINQNYKLSKRGPDFSFLFFGNFNSFIQEQRYLLAVQKSSQETLLKLETVRTNFDIQKTQKEQKQKELEDMQKKLATQKISLASQKSSKLSLLEITKNNEANYQLLLSNARAEYEAIQNIIAGNGEETFVRNVSAGEKIASVIKGASCISSGTHLHFMVKIGKSVQNPFNYLKQIDYSNNSCDRKYYPSCAFDPFNPSGSWNWPLNPKIELEQGFGATWSIDHTWVGKIYKFHTGIDIVGQSNNIYATNTGKLFRGVYNYNCKLRYVRVEGDNNISSLYLHVNY